MGVAPVDNRNFFGEWIAIRKAMHKKGHRVLYDTHLPMVVLFRWKQDAALFAFTV